MGIVAEWVTECDGCGERVEKRMELGVGTVGGGWLDIWGPGWPEGWLQVTHDGVTGRHYLFFCGAGCYCKWLERQGRHEEVERMRSAVWVA